MKALRCLIVMLVACSLHAVAVDKYTYIYTEAVRQGAMGNDADAFHLYRRCLDLNPDAGEVYHALASYYSKYGQDSLALVYQKRAVALQPGNTEFGESLARNYLYRDSILAAAAVYENLVKQMPDRTDYLEMLLRIYQAQHDYAKMLSVLNRIETQEGQSETITLSKMQAYTSLDDHAGAYRELKSLIDAHPFDLNLRVMMGNWLYSTGKKDEALKTFLGVLREEPDNAQGQMSLMDYYRMEGNAEAADSLLYGILVNPHTDRETRLASVKAWVNDAEHGADSLRVMQMFDRVLSLPEKDADVATMRASYLMMKQAPTDTIKSALRQVLAIAPDNLWARITLLQQMWQDSIDEDVIRECQMAVEYIPDDPGLYYYLALAQYVNKHVDDARTSLLRGIDVIKSDTKKELASDIYSMLGDIYYKQNQAAKAFEAYDKSLEYTPTRSMTLNNYAYYLSLQKESLQKAEQMSYRAITAEANNPTYLDTYAWILYQEGRYEEARIYIDQAISCCEADTAELSGDIYDHAGDIYFRVGQPERAREFWNKALPLGVEKEAALRKKIKRGKL